MRGFQKKVEGVTDAFAETVGDGEIYGPAADDGGIEAFHKVGQVSDGKRFGDFAALLAPSEDFAEEADGDFLRATHFGRAHRIHGAGKDNGAPERLIGFHFAGHALIHAAEALGGGGVGCEIRFEVLLDAVETTATYFAENGVFTGEIAEEGGLADFEGLDDVFDAGVLVALFTEEANGSVDDLLAKARFLAFAKAESFASGHRSRASG